MAPPKWGSMRALRTCRGQGADPVRARRCPVTPVRRICSRFQARSASKGAVVGGEGLDRDARPPLVAGELGEAFAGAWRRLGACRLTVGYPRVPAIGEARDVADILGEQAGFDRVVADAGGEIDAADAERLGGKGQVEIVLADEGLVVAHRSADRHGGECAGALHRQEAEGCALFRAVDGGEDIAAVAGHGPRPSRA